MLRFSSSEAATLSILIERLRPGQKLRTGAAPVCRAVARPVKRGGCSLYSPVATLARSIDAGPGSVALSGRVRAGPLEPGSYRVTLSARDTAGNGSAPAARTFTILAGGATARQLRRRRPPSAQPA